MAPVVRPREGQGARGKGQGADVARIWTIGHSTRSSEELMGLLHEHGIRRLVDVRRFPGSRRQPQYGREALAAALAAAGIGYVHEPDLGGRRTALTDSPNGYWRHPGFRGYADYMATPEFAGALERLVTLASAQPTAILCAEAVPWRCHRQLVADALVAAGHDVAHITGPGRAQAHMLNAAARVSANGALVYPPEQVPFFDGGDGG